MRVSIIEGYRDIIKPQGGIQSCLHLLLVPLFDVRYLENRYSFFKIGAMILK